MPSNEWVVENSEEKKINRHTSASNSPTSPMCSIQYGKCNLSRMNDFENTPWIRLRLPDFFLPVSQPNNQPTNQSASQPASHPANILQHYQYCYCWFDADVVVVAVPLVLHWCCRCCCCLQYCSRNHNGITGSWHIQRHHQQHHLIVVPHTQCHSLSLASANEK